MRIRVSWNARDHLADGALRAAGHCAGQTSVDERGQPIHAGHMEAQAMQALDNLETVLREAGFALSDIARPR